MTAEKTTSTEASTMQGKETGKISVSIEAVESEADKILDEARVKANDILLKAREEANKIVNSSLSLTEVEAEKENIIRAARDEASRKLEKSKVESSRIKTALGGKEDSIVKQLVEMVTGTGAK